MKFGRLAVWYGSCFFLCAVFFSNVSFVVAQTPVTVQGGTSGVRDASMSAGSSSDIQTIRPADVDRRMVQNDNTQPAAGEDSNVPVYESPNHDADVLSIELPGEFQRFIADSIGRILPIFGRSFFTTGFAPTTSVPAPDDYIIGPGDEIILRVWGQQDFDYRLDVNHDGEVFIPQVGNVPLAGMEYRRLHDHLQARLELVYRNFNLSVSMGRLRSIQIYITGNAVRPGRHTISALDTLINVALTSGRPLMDGSMRRIQLIRNGRLVTELDLYDMLLHGDKTGDVRLQSEDIIHIPVVSKQVAISGSVRTPGIYEMKHEKTVCDAIEMARGFSTVANRDRATIERIRGGGGREIVDLFLNDGGLDEPVFDGDLIQVFTVSARFEDTVTLRGNVASPGRFTWRQGMRLRDIIPDRESLVTNDYWRRINQLGNFYREEISPMGIRTPIPDVNWAYATIERRNPDDLRTNWITFNLGKLVLENDESQNLELFSGDVVMIFSQADVRVPQAQRTRTITLQGEFNTPGIYTVGPDETLGQLMAKAGGLTRHAYLYGAEFTRMSVRRNQQEGLDVFIANAEEELNATASDRLAGAVNNEERLSVSAEISSQMQILSRMREQRSTGRIILEVQPEDNDISEIAEFVLEDGDVFTVPPRPSVISVIGEVYNPNTFIHVGNRRVNEYLQLAGGFTRNSDEKYMYIVRADGSVLPGRSVSDIRKLKLAPGDALMIPLRQNKTSIMRELGNWAQILSQFGLGVAAINNIFR